MSSVSGGALYSLMMASELFQIRLVDDKSLMVSLRYQLGGVEFAGVFGA